MDPDDDDISHLLSSALDAFKTSEFSHVMAHATETPGQSSSASSAIGELHSLAHQSQTPDLAVPNARSSSPDSLIDPSLRSVTRDHYLFADFDSTDGIEDAQEPGPRSSTQFRPSTGGKQPKAVHKRKAEDQNSSNSSDEEEDEDEDSESEDTHPSYSQFADSMVLKYALPEDLASDVCKFAQMQLKQQNIASFALMSSIANQLQLAWKPGVASNSNIRTTCKAVILSALTPCYLGDYVVRIVYTLMTHHKIGLPDDWQSDIQKLESVIGTIRFQLSQVRSELKKKMKTLADPTKKVDIGTFANKMTRSSRFSLTPSKELWGRFAIWRSIYRKNPSESFWTDLDEKLIHIRDGAKATCPDDNDMYLLAVSSQIKNVLLDDYKRYGNPMAKANGREPPPRAQLTVVGEFQNIVDRTASLPAHELEDLGVFALVEDENGGHSKGGKTPKQSKTKQTTSKKKTRTK